MANKSILAAFERIWQHTTVALSDKINKPSTATRGQVIVVKAVDDSGKPTEFEAVDLSAGGISEVQVFDFSESVDISSPREPYSVKTYIDATLMADIIEAIKLNRASFKIKYAGFSFTVIPTIAKASLGEDVAGYSCIATLTAIENSIITFEFYGTPTSDGNYELDVKYELLATQEDLDELKLQTIDLTELGVTSLNLELGNDEQKCTIEAEQMTEITKIIDSGNVMVRFTFVPYTASEDIILDVTGDISVLYLSETAKEYHITSIASDRQFEFVFSTMNNVITAKTKPIPTKDYVDSAIGNIDAALDAILGV